MAKAQNTKPLKIGPAALFEPTVQEEVVFLSREVIRRQSAIACAVMNEQWEEAERLIALQLEELRKAKAYLPAPH